MIMIRLFPLLIITTTDIYKDHISVFRLFGMMMQIGIQ